MRGVFRQVDELLSDRRRFLAGERFTAADLTFAALAAPVLLPAECRAVQPALDDVPAAMRDEILRFRETDAGRFALRMFTQERGYHSLAAPVNQFGSIERQRVIVRRKRLRRHSFGGRLQRGDVELDHLQHRVGHALGFSLSGSAISLNISVGTICHDTP